MINFGQVALGLVLILIVAGSLLYIFYSRTNAVQKNGYGALAMLSIVTLMIPVFWIIEGNYQTQANGQLQVQSIARGDALYATSCTNQCYAVDKNTQKVTIAKYNGYDFTELRLMTDNDLRRIISAGLYKGTPPNAIVNSDQYGGQLQSMDINDLMNFIRSSDPAYLKKQGYTGAAAAPSLDGFGDYLQTNYPNFYAAAVALNDAGQFGIATDFTNQNTVQMGIVQPPPGEACVPDCFQYLNIKVKVGTTITWTNQSTLGHTVTAIVGTNTATPTKATQIFDSGPNLIQSGQTFTYTVTQDAYNFNPDHTVLYYCTVHPDMLGKITIVP
jgi:plastocyanin